MQRITLASLCRLRPLACHRTHAALKKVNRSINARYLSFILTISRHKCHGPSPAAAAATARPVVPANIRCEWRQTPCCSCTARGSLAGTAQHRGKTPPEGMFLPGLYKQLHHAEDSRMSARKQTCGASAAVRRGRGGFWKGWKSTIIWESK
jgi:hypothetical protein